MDNPDTLNTWGTQDEEKRNKNTTECAGHHSAQASTNNVIKT
jgi:hypothetical protein